MGDQQGHKRIFARLGSDQRLAFGLFVLGVLSRVPCSARRAVILTCRKRCRPSTRGCETGRSRALREPCEMKYNPFVSCASRAHMIAASTAHRALELSAVRMTPWRARWSCRAARAGRSC